MQVEWGECGRVQVGSTTRKVSVLVAVLRYSRMIYIEFILVAGTECAHGLTDPERSASRSVRSSWECLPAKRRFPVEELICTASKFFGPFLNGAETNLCSSWFSYSNEILSAPLTRRRAGANHPHRYRTSSWSQPRRLRRARSRSRARDSRPLTVPTGHCSSLATCSLLLPCI
jgi:hypothetical protein